MFRAFEFFLVIMILSMTSYTFYIKHRSEERLAEIKKLEASIETQKNTIALLEVDWSLLNQPARVQKLIQAFEAQLHLKTTEANQIVQPDELPRIKFDEGFINDQIFDHIRTGAVK